jgi:hypothetical protein
MDRNQCNGKKITTMYFNLCCKSPIKYCDRSDIFYLESHTETIQCGWNLSTTKIMTSSSSGMYHSSCNNVAFLNSDISVAIKKKRKKKRKRRGYVVAASTTLSVWNLLDINIHNIKTNSFTNKLHAFEILCLYFSKYLLSSSGR